MVLSNAKDESLATKHAEICNKLGFDMQTLNESWERYQTLSQNFTLEGDPLHWIGCAIFEVCWKSGTQPSGQNYLQGRGINLITILKHCNLSVAIFFDKIHNWCDMARLSDEIRRRVHRLQDVFYVSYNTFEIYQKLYLDVFKPPEPHETDVKHHRNRKQKPVPCTSSKVFEFCWNLFITIKSEQTSFGNELVPLCHLLRAVCDWAFGMAFLSDRRDLLNPHFAGLPSEWSTVGYVVPNEAPCIVRHIINKESVTDVKYIKEYQLKKYIKNFFERGVLVSKEDDDKDVFDSSVFERNFRNVSNTYETHILNRGDFDERIFLADFKRRLLERQQNQSRPQDSADTSAAEFPEEMVASQQACLTPLTGRKYLGPKEPHDQSTPHTHTENIARLQTLLSGRQASPGEVLVQLFESCRNNPTDRVSEIVTKLGDKFVSSCGPDMSELATRRLQLARMLFYKLIESVLVNEKTIHTDLSAIVERDIFFECMFVCCLEIVIFSYKMPFKFLWVLETLKIQPYNFVKVIELIIRCKDQFSRDIIKHLNIIEERIISSLVWTSDSALWAVLESSTQGVPKFEETALPGQLQEAQGENGSCLKKILNTDMTESPGPSATDRFQTPVANTIVNRQLFPNLQNSTHTHLVIKDQDGVTKMIPIVNNETQKQVQAPSPVQQPPQQQQQNLRKELTPTKPKRTGGLSIIFRKFYNLAGERMEHLCNKLNIDSVEVKRKIWTIFEESVRLNNCELMKDRDLDQLLMCAVYMVCKLNKAYSRDFSEVMRSYRTQPQAHSDIYRKVLVTKARAEIVDGQLVEYPEDRKDLITFYNKVIIKALGKFAEKFADHRNENVEEVLLSPLPAARRQVPSVQIGHNVFVKPLESPRTEPNGKVYNYIFSRSPSKDLSEINKAIKGHGVVGKRLLVDADMDQIALKRAANRKVMSLIEERKNLE